MDLEDEAKLKEIFEYIYIEREREREREREEGFSKRDIYIQEHMYICVTYILK